LGQLLGIPQSTMWRIINQAQEMPAEYVLRAERLFGVSRHDLRPDIYPRDYPPADECVAAGGATHRLNEAAQ